MCGLAGYIGESTNPKLTFKLATKLFEKIEIRGEDASGFWGLSKDKILYHKEPVRPIKFVEKDVWKNVENYNPYLFLLHSRRASPGVGSPSDNKNNHPFVNEDLSIGLVHNGMVPHFEYKSLKNKYEVLSGCDSEIILRIFESSNLYDLEEIKSEFGDEETNIALRLMGIRDIWSHVSNAHMAVCIGEKTEECSRLWMFRNQHRSLCLIDLREQLGQIFWASTPEIWDAALEEADLKKELDYCEIKIRDLPTEEVWMFEIDEEKNIPDEKIHIFDVEHYGSPEPFEYTGDRISANPSVIDKELVYSQLEENESVS